MAIKRWIKNPIKRAIKRSVRSFSIPGLFRNGEEGAYWDPDDLTTLSQTYTGVTGNVTAVGDPVGRMEDRRAAEVFTASYTSDFSAGADSFTSVRVTADHNIDGVAGEDNWLRITMGATSDSHYVQRATTLTPVGKKVKVTCTYFIPSTNSDINGIQITDGATDVVSQVFNTIDEVTTVSFEFIVASNTTLQIYLTENGSRISEDSGTDDLVYIKDVVVSLSNLNHAIQATAGSRPLLGIQPKSGVRNRLTYSEQFDNSVWTKLDIAVTANSVVAPDGTLTADSFIANGGVGQHFVYTQSVPLVAATYEVSFSVKAGNKTNVIFGFDGDASANGATGRIDILTGTYTSEVANGGSSISGVTSTAEANGFYRIKATCVVGTAESYNIYVGPSDAGSSSFTGDSATVNCYIWGIHFGTVATTYQRKGAWYDCTEGTGITPANAAANAHVLFLAPDGVDDYLTVPGTASTWKIHDGTGWYAALGVQAGVVPSPEAAVYFLASDSGSALQTGVVLGYDDAGVVENRLKAEVHNVTGTAVAANITDETLPPNAPAVVSIAFATSLTPDYTASKNNVVQHSQAAVGTPATGSSTADMQMFRLSGGTYGQLKFFNGVIRQGVPMPDSQYQLTRTQGDAIGVTI